MVLNIRNLSPEVHRRLRIRAAEHGRSMEAEARAILEEATLRPSTESGAELARRWRTIVKDMYGGVIPTSLVQDLIAERRWEAWKEDQEARGIEP